MPLPDSSPDQPVDGPPDRSFGRRGALAAFGLAGAGVALAACSSSSGSATVDPTTRPSGSTDASIAQARRASADVETRLMELSSAVADRFPTTAGTTRTISDDHATHVTALIGTVPAATSPADASATLRDVKTASNALRVLAAAERSAAASHAKATLGLDASGARLLASIAAYASARNVTLLASAR